MRVFKILPLAVAACLGLGTLQGCAVWRDQESVGAYVDDATLTSRVTVPLRCRVISHCPQSPSLADSRTVNQRPPRRTRMICPSSTASSLRVEHFPRQPNPAA